MLSLEFQNFVYFLNNISFLAISEQKKCPFTPLKSPLLPKFSKYHTDVILSRLRDTLNIRGAAQTKNVQKKGKQAGAALGQNGI